MYDIAIIGAGVVGGMLARELSRYTLKTVLLERAEDVAVGATKANSAIVHAGFDALPGTLKARFNVEGSRMMEGVCRDLGVKYQRNGSLVVGFSDDDLETLRELLARGEKNGVPGMRLLTEKEARELEPNLGDGVKCALLAPGGAILCPYELCISAVGCAMDNGVTLRLSFPVERIERHGGVYELSGRDGSVSARYVINCAGVYSDDIAAMVGDRSFHITPRRGEYMLLDRECGDLVSHTIFRCPSKMGKGILVSPTVDGNLLLGPTAEDIKDKEDTSTTAEGLATVRRSATEQVSKIDFSKVITSFAGLRAKGDTGDFIINSPAENFINVAGIESPGLTSAPAIAKYVAEKLCDMGADLTEKPDYNPARAPMPHFRDMTEEERREAIARDPAFARVICRCETVTEGEILEAIRRNPRPSDVDGIKRRTRSTMGRCQGGFCTPYIVEILARELGIPEDMVTKSGGSSRIAADDLRGRKNEM